MSRSYHRKSRGGCLTCKSRHVKCDEQFPACLRCLRANRHCLGYEKDDDGHTARRSKKFKFVQSKYDCLAVARHSEAVFDSDTLLLPFFVNRSLPLLTGYLHCQAWNESTIKRLLFKSSVKDIATAIATYHMQLEQKATVIDVSGNEVRVLQSYSNALRATQNLLARNEHDVLSMLQGSILLLVLESLRGGKLACKTHLLGGLRLLKAHEHQLDPEVRAEIYHIFANIGLNVLFHAADFELFLEMESIPSSDFVSAMPISSLNQLRKVADFVVLDTYCYVLRVAMRLFPDPKQQEAVYQVILDKLTRVEEEAENCLHRQPKPPTLVINLIRARLTLSRIYLTSCRDGTQTAYDQYNKSFRRMVDLLKVGLEERATYTPSMSDANWTFSFGYGIMTTVTLIISQCRDPNIRRDAFQLFELCPKRECLRDVGECQRMCQAVIAYEEKGMVTIDQKSFIPEESRVHFPRFEAVSETNHQEAMFALHRTDDSVEFLLTKLSLNDTSTDSGVVSPANLSTTTTTTTTTISSSSSPQDNHDKTQGSQHDNMNININDSKPNHPHHLGISVSSIASWYDSSLDHIMSPGK